jgi:hypothetical protein
MPGPPCTGFRCPVCGRDVAARKFSRRERRPTGDAWTPLTGLLPWLSTPWYGWRCVRCGLQVESGSQRVRRTDAPEVVPRSRVVLHSVADRVEAIKALRAGTRASLRGARDAVDGAPCELGTLPTDVAVGLRERMARAGAVVDLYDTADPGPPATE